MPIAQSSARKNGEWEMYLCLDASILHGSIIPDWCDAAFKIEPDTGGLASNSRRTELPKAMPQLSAPKLEERENRRKKLERERDKKQPLSAQRERSLGGAPFPCLGLGILSRLVSGVLAGI